MLPLLLFPLPDGTELVTDPLMREAFGLLMRVAEFHWCPPTFKTEDEYMEQTYLAMQRLLQFAALAEMDFEVTTFACCLEVNQCRVACWL